MNDSNRPDSFAEIYKKYFHYIYLYALSLTQDEHLAEEITQETLCRAMEHWETFDGEYKIQTWLCTIARNYYYSICRKEKRIDCSRDLFSSPEPLHKSPTASLSDTTTGRPPLLPEQALLNQESAMEIHRILHKMEDPYKEVFELHIFAELTYKQIGELFGKTEGWARTVYYRAKLKIQEALP